MKGTWLIQKMESCVTTRRNAIPDIIYRNLSAHCEWPMFLAMKREYALEFVYEKSKNKARQEVGNATAPWNFLRPTSGSQGILKSLLPFSMDKDRPWRSRTSQWNLKKCWKAPPIKETSWSSALRVNAKVFQWVKKALSIVRKKSLKGIRSLKQFFEGGQNAPCCKEKVKVFPCESLRDQKIDRLCQSLHMMIVSLTYHNSFSCKFWIKDLCFYWNEILWPFHAKKKAWIVDK